ncbi:histidine kinase N-terminal domain-containing protein [Amycolatopsis mongoliensis]|uniref:histidine kinase n=2 Tax=Amycolatopsis TaxID=1813 RepID=A0A9Y2JYF5_9PSEU|nr:PAS domain-containing sensor histidine kinase [Amycolatopsis sp. 4-36]WIY05931.1 histidine kinase N-terminal domain-containing protein [Amycolatopsis sp. 4-36]
MSTLAELLADNTGLPGEAADHLQTVVAEWQLLADLSFADFLLWVPVTEELQPDGGDFVCVAHARPTTAPTAHPEDVVGTRFTVEEHPQLAKAMREARICREEDPHWYRDLPMRREAIPVRFHDDVIAVMSRETNLAAPRVPSPLEIAYLGSAGDLCQMIVDGTFPPSGTNATDTHTSPRVGDGLIRLDSSGTVVFASPNGLSAYHRMGHESDLVGTRLAPLTRSLIRDPFDATEVSHRIIEALDGKPSSRTEADSRRGAVVLFRALPLRPAGQAAGALVLVRDVTEVKRRDRALLSKDATIREIHHRVKNNLQTVAALLRLQSRRTSSEEARLALAESVRRVTSIALVHEALSISVDERVDLDKLLDNVLPMVGEVATPESQVGLTRKGSFGVVVAEIATPLVMVLAELVQNAIEHAFPAGRSGKVELIVERSARWLDVVIRDNGRGLPAGFSLERSDGLGLQIVRTLVESELRGSLSLRKVRVEASSTRVTGTEAALRIPLSRRL